MKRQANYPFSAIVGQEQLKMALIISSVNPKTGGVLIVGERGTAKSTAVRALADVMEHTAMIQLPLNVTEEMVAGTVKLDQAIKSGTRVLEEGLLSKADGQILYIDEVNLLSDNITKLILDAAATGIHRVEREGISCVRPSRFTLIGTMNPEEGLLSPQISDRFGLCVTVNGEKHVAVRVAILKKRLTYEKDRQQFCFAYMEETNRLREKIQRAQERLPKVTVSEELMTLCVRIALEANCAGHRADIFLLEAAKAIAAFNERLEVTEADIREAAPYVIAHRMRERPDVESEPVTDRPENNHRQEEAAEEPETTNEREAGQLQHQPQEDGMTTGEMPPDDMETDSEEKQRAAAQDTVAEIGEQLQLTSMFAASKDRRSRAGNGKRSKTRSGTKQGRFIKAAPMPAGKITDIALMATIRAAAPYQKSRREDGRAIVITDADLRKKVREKRIGNTLLFVVDASGSMGAQQRMRAVKGAIVSLLHDAYQKRDSVGMVAFRNDDAELLLDMTRSVDLAHKALRELPTGGKTPLACGLSAGFRRLQKMRKQEPESLPMMIVVTDGKANAGMYGGDPVKEALTIARQIAASGLPSLIIDIETGFIQLGIAKLLAKTMNAEYYKLDELKADTIVQAVRSMSSPSF
ncbi:magnesium chelatase subunit D [Evansella caseinilytica]|uniref:Magnesium chelatase subunit D n=1 Tax=Evansella caseinilytica TaxID=1503961 RepID=A0A1H3SDI6_9BACI|nr:VWA domain-containing protein [Evansella caseinilytica]SDZ35621.1 magnesium chelatase subunit D [Evansella caseinilytica]